VTPESNPGRPNVTAFEHLPSGVFEHAVERRLEVERQRIAGCYNRTRALFAEALVAQLLPGADVVVNPVAAWDVTWKPRGLPSTRIQVKCSGGWIPRFPDRVREIPARWEVREPRSGFGLAFERLDPGHQCEMFVFARHTGSDIAAGWSFYVLPTTVVVKNGKSAATADRLLAMGAKHCEPRRLAATIRGFLARPARLPSRRDIGRTRRTAQEMTQAWP
jgi:hypothetical protein